ncbi:hypothetical protein DPMN_151423 [Dreissena polymorpha]|uniref:Uncharacterized protein n=1 Tax=Dreissena polymorpha TaxID=45954 RepID=A0A9D4FJX7_DREPO|nr:hypothetical protein DPMN_151423 [Dreissena polymorpha]
MFGSKCKFQCDIKYFSRSCSMSGDCNLGCSTNTFGLKCDKPCPNNCHQIEGSSSCVQDDASCKFGCQDSYRGTTCEEG